MLKVISFINAVQENLNIMLNKMLWNAVLIEKILRTVPDVGKIYVMIKAEDKEAAFERLHTEVNSVFVS